VLCKGCAEAKGTGRSCAEKATGIWIGASNLRVSFSRPSCRAGADHTQIRSVPVHLVSFLRVRRAYLCIRYLGFRPTPLALRLSDCISHFGMRNSLSVSYERNAKGPWPVGGPNSATCVHNARRTSDTKADYIGEAIPGVPDVILCPM
jgi:hypothetical protein